MTESYDTSDPRAGSPRWEFEDSLAIDETPAALRVQSPSLDPLECARDRDEGVDRAWVPKSALHPDSEVFSCHPLENAGKLILHSWFVEKKSNGVSREEEASSYWTGKPPRGKEVPTPEVLRRENLPMKPPGRK